MLRNKKRKSLGESPLPALTAETLNLHFHEAVTNFNIALQKHQNNNPNQLSLLRREYLHIKKLYRKLEGDAPKKQFILAAVAYADIYSKKNLYSLAQAVLQDALNEYDLLATISDDLPSKDELNFTLSKYYIHMGMQQMLRKDFLSASCLLENALTILSALQKEFAEKATYYHSMCAFVLGKCAVKQKNLDRAESLFNIAKLKITNKVDSESKEPQKNELPLFQILIQQGQIALIKEDYLAATSIFNEALKLVIQHSLDVSTTDQANIKYQLGRAYNQVFLTTPPSTKEAIAEANKAARYLAEALAVYNETSKDQVVIKLIRLELLTMAHILKEHDNVKAYIKDFLNDFSKTESQEIGTAACNLLKNRLKSIAAHASLAELIPFIDFYCQLATTTLADALKQLKNQDIYTLENIQIVLLTQNQQDEGRHDVDEPQMVYALLALEKNHLNNSDNRQKLITLMKDQYRNIDIDFIAGILHLLDSPHEALTQRNFDTLLSLDQDSLKVLHDSLSSYLASNIKLSQNTLDCFFKFPLCAEEIAALAEQGFLKSDNLSTFSATLAILYPNLETAKAFCKILFFYFSSLDETEDYVKLIELAQNQKSKDFNNLYDELFSLPSSDSNAEPTKDHDEFLVLFNKYTTQPKTNYRNQFFQSESKDMGDEKNQLFRAKRSI